MAKEKSKPGFVGTMHTYRLVRGYNLRVHDTFIRKYPSDEAALAAANDAHTGELFDYHDKAEPEIESTEDHADFVDVMWHVVRLDENDPHGSIALTDEFVPLRPGYVTANDLLNVIDELADVDPDWPGEIRRLRTICRDAKDLMARLKAQGEHE